ncbi:UNVERIFIED_CONTAM: hypothetical protein FKN15_062010 [Acipenser sinensis]
MDILEYEPPVSMDILEYERNVSMDILEYEPPVSMDILEYEPPVSMDILEYERLNPLTFQTSFDVSDIDMKRNLYHQSNYIINPRLLNIYRGCVFEVDQFRGKTADLATLGSGDEKGADVNDIKGTPDTN